MVLFKTHKPKINMVNKLELHLSGIIVIFSLFLFCNVSHMKLLFNPINNWKGFNINGEDKQRRIILLVIAKYKPDRRTWDLGEEGGSLFPDSRTSMTLVPALVRRCPEHISRYCWDGELVTLQMFWGSNFDQSQPTWPSIRDNGSCSPTTSGEECKFPSPSLL